MQGPEDGPNSRDDAPQEQGGEPLVRPARPDSGLTPTEECDLMRRVALREEAAFEDLIARYRQPLFRLLLRLEHGNAGYCEDILQEVWLKVWLFAKLYRCDMPLLPWLSVMARRVRIDLWRKVRQLDQAIRIDPAAAQAGLPGVIRDIEDPELFDPVTDLELERLLECIAKLPPPLRDLVYKRLQGIPLRELVGMFGDSIPTVYRRYQKALWQIRECMGLIQPAAQGRVN